eukprot:7710971-Pyramimonas_sp.AAC.1
MAAASVVSSVTEDPPLPQGGLSPGCRRRRRRRERRGRRRLGYEEHQLHDIGSTNRFYTQ